MGTHDCQNGSPLRAGLRKQADGSGGSGGSLCGLGFRVRVTLNPMPIPETTL